MTWLRAHRSQGIHHGQNTQHIVVRFVYRIHPQQNLQQAYLDKLCQDWLNLQYYCGQALIVRSTSGVEGGGVAEKHLL